MSNNSHQVLLVGLHTIITSTLRQSQPNKAGLKRSSVRAYVHTYVCPSSTKRFFNFNEIWHVGRGQRVMHDGMQYDPIQGQGHGRF